MFASRLDRVMRKRWIASAAVVGAALLSVQSATAIGPRAGTSAATPDANHPEVGMIGDENSNPVAGAGTNTFFGTGTKVNLGGALANHVVVTAAHTVASDFLINNQLQYVSHVAQFKLDGQAGIFGLPIPHPSFDYINLGQHDVALILTTTSIPGPAAQFWSPAVGPNDVLGPPAPDILTLVGYGGRGAAPGGQYGTRLTGRAPVNALTADRISFAVPNPATAANQNWTEPGDSGSPYFKDFGGGNVRIVGIHNAGNSGADPLPNPVEFFGERVRGRANSFLVGNGVSAADRTGAIISWNIDGSSNFNTANWTSGFGATTPAAGHVAFINRAPANPTVTITQDTPVLYGLVNDERLNISGGRLRVGGGVHAPGIFNGANGQIDVQMNRQVVTTAMINAGTIDIRDRGNLTASQDSFNMGTLTVRGDPRPSPTRGIAVFNSAKGLRNLNTGTVRLNDGGALQANGFTNNGTLSLSGGDLQLLNNGNMTNSGTINATNGTFPIPGGAILT